MKLPKILVPALVVLAAALTIPLKGAFNFPAAKMAVPGGTTAQTGAIREVEMIVRGVKCKGTANFFISRYRNTEGVVDLTAFAADHKVVVKYDASKVSLDTLRAIGEAPVRGRDGKLYDVFAVEKMSPK